MSNSTKNNERKSELKEHLFVPYSELREGDELTDAFTIAKSYYLKSEADKVIAEKDKKIDLYHRGWEESDRINASIYAELHHQKYKRCLAMAMWCKAERDIFNLTPKTTKAKFFARWHKRWLAIAEKFKEVR